MACRQPFHMNHIWSVWYVIVMVPLQAYLIHLGLGRYHLYRQNNWPNASSVQLPLNVYLTLYYITVPFLIIFAICGIFKSGNIAGDNEKFGAQTDRLPKYIRRIKKGECSLSRAIRLIWEHGPPLPQQIHVFIALSHLFAQQLMIAQLYRNSPVSSESSLNTELDFLYQRESQLRLNLPKDDTGLRGFSGRFRDLVYAPVAAKVLPVLMNFCLFGIPLEFVNLMIGLFAYCCCYSSVFWRVSKSFSFLFSLHLIIYSITLIWTYLGFSVLYRIQEINYANAQPDRFGQYLSFSKHLVIFRPEAIIAMFVTTVILMSVAPIAMFTYGYNKFIVNLFNVQHRNSARSQSDINGHSSDYIDCRSKSGHEVRSLRLCCEGYAPHIIAILLLIFIVAAKAPTIYALMVLYQHDNKALLASCIMVDITYLFSWIIFWLILTLKREWQYKVLHDVSEIMSLQNAHKMFVPTSTLTADGSTFSKNTLIVMYGDQLYFTDDHIAKQAILRHVQKNTFNCGNDEVYWLGANAHSPLRKNFVSESAKGTPEMKRLLGSTSTRRTSNDENSTLSAAYHTISRAEKSQKVQEILHQKNDTDSKRSLSFLPPEDLNTIATFGTLQRIPRADVSLMVGQQQVQNQKQIPSKASEYGIASNAAEAYATVHKPAQREAVTSFNEELKISNQENETNNNAYSSFPSGYATYARVPQVKQVSCAQRYRSDSTFAATASAPCGKQHPVKRTSNLKLSSFNSCVNPTDSNKQNTSHIPQSVPVSTWSQQKNSANIQPLNLQWNENSTYTKTSSISTVSSQQEQSYTPSSTLTSQGSVSNYTTQQIPVPGSPGLNTNQSLHSNCGTCRYGQRSTAGTCGNIGEESGSGDLYGTLTERDSRAVSSGQRQLCVLPTNHRSKAGNGSGREDSANYSLTSSNDSAENHRNTDQSLPSIEYATSVV